LHRNFRNTVWHWYWRYVGSSRCHDGTARGNASATIGSYIFFGFDGFLFLGRWGVFISNRLRVKRRLKVIVAGSVHVVFILQIQIIVYVFILGKIDSLIFVDIVIDVVFDIGDLQSASDEPYLFGL